MKKILLLLTLFSTSLIAAPVNINRADAQTLADSLSGIGEKKAQAIIAYREKNGDFQTIKSLVNVAGIGEKTIKNNRADILLTDIEEKSSQPNTKQEPKSDTQKTQEKVKN